MEKPPTFFDHVRNSGLVEIKKLKRLVDSLRARKRIKHDPRPDYPERVAALKKVEGYERLPALERYVARELLRLEWLNVWQISQLIEGRRRFTLGEYLIRDSLGQGGYANVFLAQSKKTSELVAIKVFQSPQDQPEALTRFLREAMLQESISHKNIVHLLDCGQDGNVDYLVFEYMAGGDVRRLIHDELQLPILQSVKIVSQAAEALNYLHGQNIVHRDVKPANILLTDSGDAKLGDLGLCGFWDDRGKTDPRFGKLVGTADYMAPDHILKPQQASPQWDIYSLGCTFYQMVTGIVPFPKVDSREKIMAHLRSKLVDPQVFRNDLPPELAAVITKMMAKDPARRYRTVAEVQAALAPWLEKRTTAAAAYTELVDEPEHVAVDAETLQKLRDYSASAANESGGETIISPPDDVPESGAEPDPRDRAVYAVSKALLSEQKTRDDDFHVETVDLTAVNAVPLEQEIYEIYELQQPTETGQGDFSFELPAEQIDDELPMQFDQKSLFDFVATFEQETKIPRWKTDKLSMLRRSLPLALRVRFAKREVVMRRLARQMRSGFVLDPRCGGERSHVKAEPTFRWFAWWLLTVRPYDAYGYFPSVRTLDEESDETGELPENPQKNTQGQGSAGKGSEISDRTGGAEQARAGQHHPESSLAIDTPEHVGSSVKTEYLRVRLPGRSDSMIIEVPPVITEWGDDFYPHGAVGNESRYANVSNEFDGKRPRRPFEPLTITFWLAVIFGAAMAGFFAILLLP